MNTLSTGRRCSGSDDIWNYKHTGRIIPGRSLLEAATHHQPLATYLSQNSVDALGMDRTDATLGAAIPGWPGDGGQWPGRVRPLRDTDASRMLVATGRASSTANKRTRGMVHARRDRQSPSHSALNGQSSRTTGIGVALSPAVRPDTIARAFRRSVYLWASF